MSMPRRVQISKGLLTLVMFTETRPGVAVEAVDVSAPRTQVAKRDAQTKTKTLASILNRRWMIF